MNGEDIDHRQKKKFVKNTKKGLQKFLLTNIIKQKRLNGYRKC